VETVVSEPELVKAASGGNGVLAQVKGNATGAKSKPRPVACVEKSSEPVPPPATGIPGVRVVGRVSVSPETPHVSVMEDNSSGLLLSCAPPNAHGKMESFQKFAGHLQEAVKSRKYVPPEDPYSP